MQAFRGASNEDIKSWYVQSASKEKGDWVQELAATFKSSFPQDVPTFMGETGWQASPVQQIWLTAVIHLVGPSSYGMMIQLHPYSSCSGVLPGLNQNRSSVSMDGLMSARMCSYLLGLTSCVQCED